MMNIQNVIVVIGISGIFSLGGVEGQFGGLLGANSPILSAITNVVPGCPSPQPIQDFDLEEVKDKNMLKYLPSSCILLFI